MKAIVSACAVLIAAAAATVPAGAAAADGQAEAGACVTRAQHARLGIGQTLREVRSIVGDRAQVGAVRRWSSAGNSYQERLYTMCTPTDQAHEILTVRFMWWKCTWRAQIIDTRVGPEPQAIAAPPSRGR